MKQQMNYFNDKTPSAAHKIGINHSDTLKNPEFTSSHHFLLIYSSL